MAKKTTGGLSGTASVLAAAAAAGAAGYYFYGSDNAKQHRVAASKWAKSLKKDVVTGAKKAKKLSGPALAAIVDEAASTYRDMRGVDRTHLMAAAKELKKHWRHVANEVSTKAPARAKKVAKKVVTKAKKRTKAAVRRPR